MDDRYIPHIRRYFLPFTVALLLVSVASYYLIFFGDMQFGGEAVLVAERGGDGAVSLEDAGVDSPVLEQLLDEAGENGSADVRLDYDRAMELVTSLREAAGQEGAVDVLHGGESYRVRLVIE